ncbi:protein kinase domain protein [Metarhizium brunneum]
MLQTAAKARRLHHRLSQTRLANGNDHLSAIQSHRFRAPEVILGCPWSYSVQIWNLGFLMWNLMEGIGLFDRPAGEDGEYNAHVHLAQMVSLLGEHDEECMKRERFFRNYRLEKPVVNSRGKECNAMTEFWVGPFFNDENDIVRTDLVERKRLADTVTELVGHEKDVFLDFASGVLQWLPENRKTARELLQHPIFDSLNERHAQWRE